MPLPVGDGRQDKIFAGLEWRRLLAIAPARRRIFKENILHTPCRKLAGLKTPNNIQPGEHSTGSGVDGLRHNFYPERGRQSAELGQLRRAGSELRQLQLERQPQRQSRVFRSDDV